MTMLLSWILVVLWASLIFYLSSIPGLKTEFGLWDTVLRKCAHVTEFAILTALLWRAFRRTWNMDFWRLARWCGGLALLYAMSDEFHQSFVPHRGPSVWDVMIDAVGIVGVLYFFHKKNEQA